MTYASNLTIDSARIWSLRTVSLTVIFASITHAYEFGAPAFVAGAVGIAVLAGLSALHRRTGGTTSLVVYGLLNAWVIIGFGLVGGFWNHAVKVLLVRLHDGDLPSAFAPFFMTTDLGSGPYEAIGVLTFVASVFTAIAGYRWLRALRTSTRADAAPRGDVPSVVSDY